VSTQLARVGFFGLLCVLLQTSCTGGGYAELPFGAEVRNKPIPRNYPSADPQKYEVITMLKAGSCVQVLNRGFGKDFEYAEIKIGSFRGFIVLGENNQSLVSRDFCAS
jgi:hypothetical protein